VGSAALSARDDAYVKFAACVECPRCHQPKGSPCRDWRGGWRWPHAARFELSAHRGSEEDR
jgi:hypothetical protein